MKELNFAILLLRRFFFQSLIIFLSLAYLTFSVGKIVGNLSESAHYRQSLLQFDRDIISPKGSSIEHLKLVLRLEGAGREYIPSNLYKTLSEKSQVHFEDQGTFSPSPALNLAAVLFWAHADEFQVVGVDSNFSKIIPAWTHLALQSNEVLIGAEMALEKNLKAGDSIEVDVDLGSYLTSPLKVNLKIREVLPRIENRWDRVALTNLSWAQEQLLPSKISANLVWKNNIISYILVDGAKDERNKLKELVEKRTVAAYIETQEEVRRLLEFLGLDSRKDLLFAILILGLGLLSLYSVLSVQIVKMKQINEVLKKSQYSVARIRKIQFAYFSLIVIPAFAFGFLLLYWIA